MSVSEVYNDDGDGMHPLWFGEAKTFYKINCFTIYNKQIHVNLLSDWFYLIFQQETPTQMSSLVSGVIQNTAQLTLQYQFWSQSRAARDLFELEHDFAKERHIRIQQ